MILLNELIDRCVKDVRVKSNIIKNNYYLYFKSFDSMVLLLTTNLGVEERILFIDMLYELVRTIIFRLLKEREIYSSFTMNSLNSNLKLELDKGFRVRRLISTEFMFDKTEEGSGFWYSLSEEFDKKLAYIMSYDS